MIRSLFPFDRTFWRRPVMVLAPANHSSASDMGRSEAFIIDRQAVTLEIFSGPRDWTRLDRLQVLTNWIDVMPKAAGVLQWDRGTSKG
jgi:hypothetical protein